MKKFLMSECFSKSELYQTVRNDLNEMKNECQQSILLLL